MRTELGGRIVRFGDVRAGSLFRFARGDDEFLAIKVKSAKQEALVALNPTNEQLNRRPWLIERSRQADDLVFEVDDAILRPGRKQGEVKLRENEVWRIGDIGLSVGRTLLCVGLSVDVLRYIDVATGEVLDSAQAWAVIHGWEIVRIVDGKPEVLFSYPPAGK